MKRNGNAERRRRENRGVDGVGSGEGLSHPQYGRGLGRGLCPLHRNCFDFLSSNGAFWCILGACFNVSIITILKQS